MSKLTPKLHSFSELADINELIIPLKALADSRRTGAAAIAVDIINERVKKQ
ncbi:MAG: hypothetical protein MJK15_12465 [Colwellia sp.]|nr:hypothetical protein [Colwellia sp.]